MEKTQPLSTKLYIPQTRPELVPRERLNEQLNEGVNRKLTLVSAPAGFGKTTLISEWATHCSRPIAWLSLDKGDNDPLRFLTYLVAAFKKFDGDLGKSLLDELQSSEQYHIEALLTELINQIITLLGSPGALQSVDTGMVLVLDDYHFITNQSVHDVISFLIEHQPDHLHTVIITRADPPIPIARMRGRGQLTELRQGDLSFTLEEASGFFNRVMGLGLSPEGIAALNMRTEGWIAGLQMAALALQARLSKESFSGAHIEQSGEITSFIESFTGSNRFVLDYLVEEVLGQQPENIQSFLLVTSILDRLSGSLCDAVIGDNEDDSLYRVHLSNNSNTILEYLERSNLFVVPLDDSREWYRYHQLFADLLCKRLEQEYKHMLPILHERASLWFEDNNLFSSAIDHALSAGDYSRAARLIVQIAEIIFKHSEITTFVNWMDKLPDELVRSNPYLSLYYAWALLINGRPIDAVHERLKDADVKSVSISGRVTALRSYIAAFQGEEKIAANLAQDALEKLGEDDAFMRSIATWTLGISYSLSGDMTSGRLAMDKAIRLSQKSGNLMTAVMGLCTLAETCMSQARLYEAKAIYEQALSIATSKSGAYLPIAGMALIGLGELSREWNELETAKRYIYEGIDLIKQQGEIGALDGYVALARVRQAQGDIDGASEAIQRAEQLAIQLDFTEFDDFLVDAHRVRLLTIQGKLEATKQKLDEWDVWTEGRTSRIKGSDNYVTSEVKRYLQVLRARVLVAQDKGGKALELLEPLLPYVEQQGKVRRSIEILNQMAKAYYVQGDKARALAALETALKRAEPSGYMRIFLDEGESMRELLRLAAAEGIAVDYVRRLLAAFEREVSRFPVADVPLSPAIPHPQSYTQDTLVEPLTEREIEVLRMLPSHLSIPEIANELYVAISTVRSHIKSIYSKLDAHSRGEAIGKAKDLKYL